MRAIDRAWPALPLMTLALAVVIGLIGVVAAPKPSERQRVEDALQHFGRALQDQDGARSCALLTEAAQKAVVSRTQTLDCPTTIRSIGFGIDGNALRTSVVKDVQITGDMAVVPRAALITTANVPFGRTFTLQLVGGAWKVAALSDS